MKRTEVQRSMCLKLLDGLIFVLAVQFQLIGTEPPYQRRVPETHADKVVPDQMAEHSCCSCYKDLEIPRRNHSL